jgi:Flp pilus assembly protein TadG
LKASQGAKRTDDAGAVLVEFTLVAILVVIIALGVIQLAAALHVRNMAISAASEGARLAAAHDRGLAEGEARTRDLLESSIGDVSATVEASTSTVFGADAVLMEVELPVPVFGLWGVGSMHVRAHALKEVDRGS